MAEQIKSKERVAKHGEVFTAPEQVKGMLDLVKSSTANVEAKFLEPACGNGNFLVEILQRKLDSIKATEELDWMFEALKAVESIYGIDIQADNVKESKERMMATLNENYASKWGNPLMNKIPYPIINVIENVLNLNIIHGNTLEELDLSTGKPIVFYDWRADRKERIQL